jgi:hypothetical protein
MDAMPWDERFTASDLLEHARRDAADEVSPA